MYIDCDSHYFPVKFLEGVSAKYARSPRVVRNGDDVRSVLPDGTLIKNQAPKGRWHLDTRDQHVDWEGFDVHVLIPENRELLYTWDRDLGCELARAYNDAVAEDLKECAHPEKYFGVAWVFLPDVEASCREIERAVKTLGLKAVKFMGGFADANLGSEKLWPFYEKCCELDIPILVHDTASDRDGHPNPALVGIEQLYLEVENNALPFLLAFPFPLYSGHRKSHSSGSIERIPEAAGLLRRGLRRLCSMVDGPIGYGSESEKEARQTAARIFQPDMGFSFRGRKLSQIRLRLLEGS
jgi:hypothetical protein